MADSCVGSTVAYSYDLLLTMFSSQVRRVEVDKIRATLDRGAVVMLTPLGYSASGEVYNVPTEEVKLHHTTWPSNVVWRTTKLLSALARVAGLHP